MRTLAINHFNLRADRATIGALRDFYIEVVGLVEGWRPPFKFPGHWLYIGDQAVVHLVEDEAAKPSAGARNTTLDHVAFTCANLSEFEAQLQKAGVEFRKTLVPGTTQVQLFATDPSGNGVEFNFSSADA